MTMVHFKEMPMEFDPPADGYYFLCSIGGKYLNAMEFTQKYGWNTSILWNNIPIIESQIPKERMSASHRCWLMPITENERHELGAWDYVQLLEEVDSRIGTTMDQNEEDLRERGFASEQIVEHEEPLRKARKAIDKLIADLEGEIN